MTTLPELIAGIRTTSPAALGNLDDAVVTRVVRAAFAAVASEIDKAPEGVHKVAGLGVFRVRKVEVSGDGRGGGRRVLFIAKPANPNEAA